MKRLLIALVSLAMVLAACGDGTGTDESGDDAEATQTTSAPDQGAPTTEAPADEGSDSGSGGASGLPPGGTGTVTIGGETIQSEWVGNCLIDEQFNPVPGDLDLTAALGSGIDALFLNVDYQEVPAGLMGAFGGSGVSIQRRGDDGEFDFYEMSDRYLVSPDGDWYEDEEGALMVQLMTGREIEDEPLPSAPIDLSSDRIAGTVTMEMEGSSDTVEVSFDLEIADPVDCSLGS